ncbi:hypothetical protein AX769_08945 [Frondihabitans sp. PAMC 28766]|uniref:hypothetical protein n=1 Tax=Frondihabitans sp. PAMC 28766 TaxID=1795630 RepID=UPI00078E048B|nr:hypothetical protein [Frondihabitans sp. PAMC 28766]AMM20266.1 hypothetical protein AX769_08945 [Frondihabitans sp. PAMC 28766]
MSYTIDVDPVGYTDAAAATKGLLSELREAGHTVVSGLHSSHGMAGSDQGGQAWATSYDAGAKSILRDTSSLLTAFDSIAVALGVTGYNHAVAEHRAAGGAGTPGGVSLPSTVAVETLPTPPSSHGGNRQFPWGFQYVADLIGMAWPDGDTDELRGAASRWDAFAASVDGIDTGGPLSAFGGFTSPEIPGIEAKFTAARGIVSSLASQARALAAGCRKRADTIEKVHGDTERELAQLAATIAATVAASALLTPFTLGLSDAAGAGAVATETGISVARIVAWLTEAVETTISTAGEIAEAVSGITGLGPAIASLGVRVAPMVLVGGVNAVVQGGSSAAIDGVVNGSSANIGADVLFGALPGGSALHDAEATGAKVAEAGSREAAEAAAEKSAGSAVPVADRESLRGIDRGDGRDIFGKYTGADIVSADKEAAGLARYERLTGKKPIADQVLSHADGFDHGRRYDGLVKNADGTYTGVEVKSGSALAKYNSKNNVQRLFDEAVNRGTVAHATLNGEPIHITAVRVVEVP